MKIPHQSVNTPQVPANNTSRQSTTSAPEEMSEELINVAKQQVQSVSDADQQVLNRANLHDMEINSDTVYEPERFVKVSQTLYFGELPSLFRDMQSHYQSFMGELSQSAPELTQENWGFSIDEHGQFVVSGSISDEQKNYLSDKLNSNEEMLKLAQQVPGVLMKGLAYDRGADGKANAWGKYDVNNENLKDILDFRAVLDDSYSARGDIAQFKNNFDVLKFVESVAGQLRSNAEVKFSY
ncbi:hypothetical protein [Pseudoalteromonas sp. OOF1S-7]|uniref:hypothetical protein n=1 Tax=Pseudoalteromonas sp. OOF1S-7 TaxID=2917757 RepID=UPI001EF73A66|nr:hypothetical protein [Pseudoalteromonas sp. OOF1S-7]MCG7535593.1 hypothetical protein [Pseudoalteromonas sp. OOF1S-7]